MSDVTDQDQEQDTDVGGIAADRLRSIIERVERLEEERKALADDIKDIFQEGKSADFDVKVIRQIIRIRKQEPAEVEEQETLLDLYRRVKGWPESGGELVDMATFLTLPNSWMVIVDLLGVAIAGGMFVVPLYAFLTTTVPKSETAHTIAANNIVNSGAMVIGSLLYIALVAMGVTVAETLLIVAVASIVAAWLAWKLHLACD